jgi:hypothetical protein
MQRSTMLRIDESSKTLVAPESNDFVPDAPPARDELHALITAGWDAFAAEIGQTRLKAVAAVPEPGIDMLAMDVEAGRITVVIVDEGAGKGAMGRAMMAAATVSSWDGDKLGAMHELLQGATPGDSPRMLVVGATFDSDATRLADWLSEKHTMDITGWAVEVLRRGDERMLSVVPAYPAAPPPPQIIATVDASNSAPPPPPPVPAPEAA